MTEGGGVKKFPNLCDAIYQSQHNEKYNRHI